MFFRVAPMGSCEDSLIAEFDQLANRIGSQPKDQQQAAIDQWFRSLNSSQLRDAFRLVSIYKAREQIAINTGNLTLGDNIVSNENISLNTGGGDVTGSAIGRGAKVDAQFIQSIKGNIESSAAIDIAGQQALKDAVDEIAEQDWGEELKKEVLVEVDKLRQEISKAEPNTTMLRKCWGAIIAVGQTLPKIAALGAWLAERFPMLSDMVG